MVDGQRNSIHFGLSLRIMRSGILPKLIGSVMSLKPWLESTIDNAFKWRISDIVSQVKVSMNKEVNVSFFQRSQKRVKEFVVVIS
jgi:hypothetical protein